MSNDMERNTPAMTFFQLPELEEALSRFLTSHDMTILMRTCRSIHQHAEPLFWRHLQASLGWSNRRGLDTTVREAFLRNNHFIRTVQSSAEFLGCCWDADSPQLLLLSGNRSSKPTHLCPSDFPISNMVHLTKLQCRANGSTAWTSFVLRVVQSNLSLQSLGLHAATFSEATQMDALVVTLPQLESLRALEISSVHCGTLTLELIFGILSNCPSGLEDLSLRLSGSSSEIPTNFLQDQPSAPHLKLLPKLRRFYLQQNMQLTPEVAVWILALCPALEDLTLHRLNEQVNLQLERIIRDDFGHLQHLGFDLEAYSDHSDAALVVLACKKLQSIRVTRHRESLGPAFVEAVLHHSVTLSEVSFTHCEGPNSPLALRILGRCALLRKFEASGSGVVYGGLNGHFNSDDIRGLSIASRQLETFVMTIAWRSATDNTHGCGPYTQEETTAVQDLFGQLALLPQLRVLDLQFFSMHVTLFGSGERYQEDWVDWFRVGHSLRVLEAAKTWRELRELRVQLECQSFSHQESQWVLDHWPKLEVIGLVPFEWDESDDEDDGRPGERKEPSPFDVLRASRPGLQLIRSPSRYSETFQ